MLIISTEVCCEKNQYRRISQSTISLKCPPQNVVFALQAGVWAGQGGGLVALVQAEPTIGLLLELIALGDFGGGNVVYNGTAQPLRGYGANYVRYRPTPRPRWQPIWSAVQQQQQPHRSRGRNGGGIRLNYL